MFDRYQIIWQNKKQTESEGKSNLKLPSSLNANAGIYFSNTTASLAELDKLTTAIKVMLEPVRDEQFVVFNNAYQYLEFVFTSQPPDQFRLTTLMIQACPGAQKFVQGFLLKALTVCWQTRSPT